MFESERRGAAEGAPSVASTERAFELSTGLQLLLHGNRSPSRVIAIGERAEVTPELVTALAAVDADQLHEDEALGLTLSWQRIANYAEAQRTRAVAVTVKVSPESPQVPRELHASAQLGAALGLGSGAADTLVSASPELTGRLHRTFAAMCDGSLSWRKGSSLAMSTIGLTDAQAAAVEAKVLPKAADRSPARHDAAIRRAVDQVDPDAADRKRKDRERTIRAVKHHYGAGMGQYFIDAPSEWIDTIDTAATSYARRMKAAGDPRTLEILKVHYFYAAAISQLSHGDPTHCGQHCDPPTDNFPGES